MSMADELVNIEIDGVPVKARKGEMLIRVTDAHGAYVPRFCYHDKLSVAANCRMCLVEVEKAPKPLPACATPVMEGMKVFTKSARAIGAQRATMEFLLINHPLDCPICDQGGECELQDLAVGFGRDLSRYHEGKRSVPDENLGPLIATDMTRCIHCTRCIRFTEEIAGIQELGMIGRGEHMKVRTYIESTVNHELSGNVIDLCPVGALISKPYRFSARAWEMSSTALISPHDPVGTNLFGHVLRGRLMRVVPRENEAINETWIADRDRFSYEGIYSPDRLTTALLRRGASWAESDWERALGEAAAGLRARAGDLGVLVSPSCTLEELYLAARIARGLGTQNVDHRLRQRDFRDQQADPVFPGLGMALADVEALDSLLVIGANLRREVPILAHRLRKAALRGAQVAMLNPARFPHLFPVRAQLTSAPADLVGDLAAALAQLTGATLGRLAEGGNAAGAYLAGAIPHRLAGARAAARPGLTARDMLQRPLRAYLLVGGLEPSIDALDPESLRMLAKAELVVAVTPFASEEAKRIARVLLPMGTFAETSGTYVNCEGLWQSHPGAAAPVGEARPGWKVLRVLGNLLGLEGFDYQSSEDVLREVREACAGVKPAGYQGSHAVPRAADAIDGAARQPLVDVPMYQTDAVVRRA